MSHDIYQNVEEIISEIDMSNDGIPWLIIEGNTDYNFLATKALPNNPKQIPVSGWENVNYVIKTVIDDKLSNNVYGFMDRDYRKELGICIDNPEKIIESDFRDIEISMFESEALQKILIEYGSKTKLPMKDNNIDINIIRDKIYSIASIIGKIRFYTQKNRLSISVKGLNYDKFFDITSFDVCTEKLAKHINDNNQNVVINKETLETIISDNLSGKLSDNKFICSGHNVIELLGLTLKKYWGTNNSKSTSKEEMEKLFRIGYPSSEFENTTMCKGLIKLLQ